jgi:hypothetical protein
MSTAATAITTHGGIYGDTTRELHSFWLNRVRERKKKDPDEEEAEAEVEAEARTLPHEALQILFNDIHLYPSKSQIFEMVQCARECSNQLRNKHSRSESSNVTSTASTPECEEEMAPFGAAAVAAVAAAATTTPPRRKDSLTFGEFCVFATELKKYYRNHERDSHQADAAVALATSPSAGSIEKAVATATIPPCGVGGDGGVGSDRNCLRLKTQKSSNCPSYDVFLGGSCNPTTWRQETAMPSLKSLGITYYNPQQSNWVPEMIELEHQAKQTSQIILMVMNDQTRNVVSMIESSYLAGARRRIIVVIRPYPDSSHAICGEELSEAELRDLNSALTTVHDLVERQGFPVFNDLTIALSCLCRVLKENVPIESLSLSDRAQPVKLAHLQIGDKLVRLREAFDTLDSTRCGMITLADVRMAFRVHARRDLDQEDLLKIVSAHDSAAAAAVLGGSRKKKKIGVTGVCGSGGSAVALDLVMIDFDRFCCIVSEFKNKHVNHTNKEAVEASPKKKCKERRTRSSCGGKTSYVLRGVLQPFSKIAHWVGSSLSSSSPDRTEPESAPQPPPTFKASESAQLAKRRGSQMRDVYLGGTISRGVRWRERDAVPQLKKHGLTFFNPHQSKTPRRLIPIEAAAMDNSRVLLFVILGTARSVDAMCEAAYHIGKGASIVLCLQRMTEDVTIGREKLSKAALKDYNRGRSYLSDFANREGVPVFEEIGEAVQCVLQKCGGLK